MTDTRQLEFVAVETPKSGRCHGEGCPGYIHWLRGDDFPKCKRCGRAHWFREVVGDKATGALTIARLEAVVESAKRGAAKGECSKPGKIAEVMEAPNSENGVYVFGMFVRSFASVSEAESAAEAFDAAYLRHQEATPDAKTIDDFEAEVKTLSETIAKQTRWNSEHEAFIATLNMVVTEKAKRIAELEATPAPPADSREAFDEWANPKSINTELTHAAWLAALAWRGSKPGKIADVVGNARGRYVVRVCGHEVAVYSIENSAIQHAADINAAYRKQCEAEKEDTDGN